MKGLTDAAERWLADHHCVIGTSHLRVCGVGPDLTERLVRDRVLRRVTRGVYVLAGSPSTLHQRCTILCFSHPNGFITGPTAGMLAGLRRMPRSAGLHFSSRHGVHLTDEAGVVFRQTTKLTPADRMSRPDGIVTASWARLAFDLGADLRQLDHRSVIEQLLDQGLVTAEQLRAIGARLCHPARPGSTTFRRTIETLGSGRAQDSHAEVVLLDRLRELGVPVVAQVAVRTAAGEFHVDLGVSDARWGVELDVHPEHRTLPGHRADAERRRAINDCDWQVELVTELDMEDPAGLARQLAANYTRRARRVSGDRSAGKVTVARPTLRRRSTLGWEDVRRGVR
jgi:hypothetical protein